MREYDDEMEMEEEERPSRSSKKRAATRLQQIGEYLAEMPISEMKKLDIPDWLKNELEVTKSVTQHGARNRQLQYIGTLMRKIDIEPLSEVIEKMDRTKGQKKRAKRR